MIIVIFNGNPNPDDVEFDASLESFISGLSKRGHSVDELRLREKQLGYCIGCWSCWWKTPGRCAIDDDIHTVCRAYIQSDFVVFASPLRMGFPSALLKKTQDRLIPLLHPYLTFEGETFRHRLRYSRYPGLGLFLASERDTTPEDIRIVADIYRRFAFNFKTNLRFAHLTHQPTEEAFHALDSV